MSTAHPLAAPRLLGLSAVYAVVATAQGYAPTLLGEPAVVRFLLWTFGVIGLRIAMLILLPRVS